MATVSSLSAEDLTFTLRYQYELKEIAGRFEQRMRRESWKPNETAIVVCDVWDLHHSLNAVRRIGEFGPRLNEVLKEARGQGVTIVHSPSDCMDAYVEHPARHRAIETPKAAELPDDIRSWCSRIPQEEKTVYPLDQSDGGDDDDPEEHAEWAAKLKAMGRNPGTPWKRQSDLITIDDRRDYISDRGDEVWSILEHRGIENVILTGVHTNMCVLGRPFGLRQMARNGKNVVLMRDMTDTMYNPARWPYVSHFTGNDLIVSHIEKFVCPTITSDQILGGKPFRFKDDKRTHRASEISEDETQRFIRHWSLMPVPGSWAVASPNLKDYTGVVWYRCSVRLRDNWIEPSGVVFEHRRQSVGLKVWFNGHELKRRPDRKRGSRYLIKKDLIEANDANLLVVRLDKGQGDRGWQVAPRVLSNDQQLELKGRWQFRIGDDPAWSNIPLPARYGTSTDIVFEP
jgi:nicotinamidase-related amidase